jgi:hypothetical protein
MLVSCRHREVFVSSSIELPRDLAHHLKPEI